MGEQRFSPRPEAYEAMDEANRKSWYLTGPTHLRPFGVYMSATSAGGNRVMYNQFSDDPEIVAAGKAANRLLHLARLGGNMSTVSVDGVPYGPKSLPPDERQEDARHNMRRFLSEAGIDAAMVRVLFPERDYSNPLRAVSIDDDPVVYDEIEPARLSERSDMVYTYNPNIVFGVRPADCPIVFLEAETPKGTIRIMHHEAWQRAANNGMDEFAIELEKLGVDLSTAHVYVTPGGQEESFVYPKADYHPHEKFPNAKDLFKQVVETGEGNDKNFAFMIDTPRFVYEKLLEMGFDKKQIFIDTSDTTSPRSGYASHSRASRLDDDNSRDFVVMKTERPYEPLVASNPERPTPPEVEWQIVPLEVEYVDFKGVQKTGTIEVNRDVYDDVKAFFAKALEIGFPIENVVRSSDPEYLWDDDKLMAANTTSGFNYRLIAGTDEPSQHGWGRAFDVNTMLNPYIKYDKTDGTPHPQPSHAIYDPDKPGTLTADHPLVILMKERGWDWGGDWERDDRPGEKSRKDLQHFEKRATTSV